MSGYCSMLWNMSEEIVGDVKPVRKIKKTLTCSTSRLGVVERFRHYIPALQLCYTAALFRLDGGNYSATIKIVLNQAV